jgi:AcrR family transcriptional regulator
MMAETAEQGQRRGAARHAGLKAGSKHTQTGRRARGAKPLGAASRLRVPLSRERIVAAALAVVEDRGLPGFTFRRLGDALGCEAMSVYHYFPAKQHLVDAMVEHALAGVREPAAGLLPVDRLRFVGREYRAMAHRHPKLFPLIALHRLNMPAGVAFIERMLRHFHAALPDDRLAAQAFRIFGYYVIGAALDETAGYAQGPSAAEPVADDFIARECPRLAAAAPFFKRPHFESTFDLGFEMMLKGIMELGAALVAGGRPPPKPVVRPKA